mgnify:CR=1 FL=1
MVTIKHLSLDEAWASLTDEQKQERLRSIDASCRWLEAHYPWLSKELRHVWEESLTADNNMGIIDACETAIEMLLEGRCRFGELLLGFVGGAAFVVAAGVGAIIVWAW